MLFATKNRKGKEIVHAYAIITCFIDTICNIHYQMKPKNWFEITIKLKLRAKIRKYNLNNEFDQSIINNIWITIFIPNKTFSFVNLTYLSITKKELNQAIFLIIIHFDSLLKQSAMLAVWCLFKWNELAILLLHCLLFLCTHTFSFFHFLQLL